MADNTGTNKAHKYYGFALASMLATNSALRQDYSNLPFLDKTPDNLRELIRNSLYTAQPGVRDQKLSVQKPAQTDSDLENVIKLIDVYELHSKWSILNAASDCIDQALAGLFSDYSGSCPSGDEQATMYRALGDVGLQRT